MYIYILHFDTKLHHAEHYVGSAANVPARLEDHAKGHGARLTQVLIEKGITWRLGAVAQCHDPKHRRVCERHLKNMKKARLFCEICCGEHARRIPNTQPLLLEMFKGMNLSENEIPF
jgi:predicted GIY-YIG superfamily endonuclease